MLGLIGDPIQEVGPAPVRFRNSRKSLGTFGNAFAVFIGSPAAPPPVAELSLFPTRTFLFRPLVEGVALLLNFISNRGVFLPALFERRLRVGDRALAYLPLICGCFFSLSLLFTAALLFREGRGRFARLFIVGRRWGGRWGFLSGLPVLFAGWVIVAPVCGSDVGRCAFSLKVSLVPTRRFTMMPGLAIAAAMIFASSASRAKPEWKDCCWRPRPQAPPSWTVLLSRRSKKPCEVT